MFNMKSIISDFLKKQGSSIINCKCQTCGTVFLEDMFLSDFVKKSNAFDIGRMQTMDRWFKKAQVHFKKYPKHQIRLKCPLIKEPMSGFELQAFPNDLTAFFKSLNAKTEI